jgi:hypothetical protein
MNVLSLYIEHVFERLSIFLFFLISRFIIILRSDSTVIKVKDSLLVSLSIFNVIISITLDQVCCTWLLGRGEMELILVSCSQKSEMILLALEVYSIELSNSGIWSNHLTISKESPDLSKSH